MIYPIYKQIKPIIDMYICTIIYKQNLIYILSPENMQSRAKQTHSPQTTKQIK